MTGLRRDIAAGTYFTSPYVQTNVPRVSLVEVTRGADGSLLSESHFLRGTFSFNYGEGLSGDFDLVLIDAEDTPVRGSFAGVLLPADSCR
jgi:hypothetical protein